MTNPYGRTVIVPLANQSGGGVIAGDVVVVDTAHDSSFTTTTSANFTGGVGVAQQTIGAGSTGLVALSGQVDLVNVNASVTRGHFGATYTVAKQATDAGAARGAGTFCQFLTGGTTPKAVLYPVDLLGTSLTNPMTTVGDLIVGGTVTGGVAAPARFGVGAATQALMGGSTPAWGPGAATSWTPALTAASVNPTLGSGSAVEGHYIQIGKLVNAWCQITWGTSGTAQGTGEYYISLPVNMVTTSPRTFGPVLMYNAATGQFSLGAAYYSSATVFRIAVTGSGPTGGPGAPFAWGANDAIIAQLTYEAA